MILLMIYSWEESTYTVRRFPSHPLISLFLPFSFSLAHIFAASEMFSAQDMQYSLLYFKHMRHSCSESHPSDTFLLLIICVCVCLCHTRVRKKNTQICLIVSGPRLVRIKRRVTVGKGPSSRRSVTVCSRVTLFISVAKWVNRAGSVQLPPHCRGVRVGIACGGTKVCGVRWLCLSIL